MKKPARRKPKRKSTAPIVRRSDAVRVPPSRTSARAIVLPRWLSRDDDRSTLMLLMTPVLLMALSLSAIQTGRRQMLPSDVLGPQISVQRDERAHVSHAIHPTLPTADTVDARAPEENSNPSLEVSQPPDQAPIPDTAMAAMRGADEAVGYLASDESASAAAPPAMNTEPEPVHAVDLPDASIVTAMLDPEEGANQDVDPADGLLALQLEAPPVITPGVDGSGHASDTPSPAPPPVAAEVEIAALDSGLLPPTLPEVTVTDDLPPSSNAVCRPPVSHPAPLVPYSAEAADFGARLAAAALEQTKDFVIYTAKYRHIAYPLGDLPALHGACSDVVVRAYRALGIDLQRLVQIARLGRDPNIDHRRTETLRRLFARFGQSFSVSAFPEDYQPGDIVTYYRPFSRVSRAHIAIVADVLAPSGRPMIIHNRGWGPQLEDALFSDRMTGHYRFAGFARTLAEKETTSAKLNTPIKRRTSILRHSATSKQVSASGHARSEVPPGL